MSLMRMVTKLAIGFAVAKGMRTVQQAGGIGKVLEGLQGASSSTASGGQGALDNLMKTLGGQTRTAGAGGGLADMLKGVMGAGGGAGSAASGGLAGIGGLLGGLAASRTGQSGTANSLEQLLGQDNPAQEPDEEESAGLMIRAMIMAARSDGEIDETEKATLMKTIGKEASQQDMAFVERALAAPVDASAIARDTPKGMETQVYSMSVMSISPDNQSEARYLQDLANALGVSQSAVNEIHDSFQVPRLQG